MLMAKKPNAKIELHPDAMERFERAVKVVAKSPLQHRLAKPKTARKFRGFAFYSPMYPTSSCGFFACFVRRSAARRPEVYAYRAATMALTLALSLAMPPGWRSSNARALASDIAR